MKLKLFTLLLMVALSSVAYADWFDGFNNGNSQGSGVGNTSGWGSGSSNGSSSGSGNVSGWGTGRGGADGEIDFQISFKGKGRSNMDSKMSGDGRGDWAGNAYGDTATYGNTAGNFIGSGTGYGDNGYGGWNNVGSRGGYPDYRMSYPVSSAGLSAQQIVPMPIIRPQVQLPLLRSMPPMLPQQQPMSYGYPVAGYNMQPAMPLVMRPPMQRVAPQAPNFQQVVKQQEAQVKQMRLRMMRLRNQQQMPPLSNMTAEN